LETMRSLASVSDTLSVAVQAEDHLPQRSFVACGLLWFSLAWNDVAARSTVLYAVQVRLLAAAARLRGLSGHRSDDPLEIGAWSWIAVDRHMLRHIELQPLDVAE
jgi:hypothetical protein